MNGGKGNRMMKQCVIISVLVLLLVGPPIAFVSFNVGPGRWANAAQDMLIGRHSLELSFLAVCLLWFVPMGMVFRILNVIKRRLTGQPPIEPLTKTKLHELNDKD
jgi:hypothetical protein